MESLCSLKDASRSADRVGDAGRLGAVIVPEKLEESR